MASDISTNFKIQIYYQNEPIFNGIYSINNLPETKNGSYITNLCEYKLIGTLWIVLYVNSSNATYLMV